VTIKGGKVSSCMESLEAALQWDNRGYAS